MAAAVGGQAVDDKLQLLLRLGQDPGIARAIARHGQHAGRKARVAMPAMVVLRVILPVVRRRAARLHQVAPVVHPAGLQQQLLPGAFAEGGIQVGVQPVVEQAGAHRQIGGRHAAVLLGPGLPVLCGHELLQEALGLCQRLRGAGEQVVQPHGGRPPVPVALGIGGVGHVGPGPLGSTGAEVGHHLVEEDLAAAGRACPQDRQVGGAEQQARVLSLQRRKQPHRRFRGRIHAR